MIYQLYIDDKNYELKLSKAHKSFEREKVGEDILHYNDNYFLSTSRKALLKEALAVKEMWLKDLEEKLEKVKSLKL